MTSIHNLRDSASRPRATTVAGLALAAFIFPTGAGAQELAGSATLYGWLPWIDGEVTSKSSGGSANTSISGGDVLEALKFAFMMSGEVHYGRVGILLDTVYSKLGQDGNLSGPFSSEVDIDLEMLLVTTAVSYQVYVENGRLIEPYVGVRYVNTKFDVAVTGGGPLGLGNSADVKAHWWDPLIGVRGRLPLTDQLTLAGSANIGGFGAGSELTWEIFAGLDYAFNERFSANAGFRYIAIDYEGSRGELDLDMYGPLLGMTLRF